MQRKPTSSKTWDALSQYFNTFKEDGSIEAGAADNILIAWPVLIEIINKFLPKFSSKKALDYGCGTGGFCNTLNNLGFKTTGIDYAKEMLVVAKKYKKKEVALFTGDAFSAKTLAKKNDGFDLVTSVMVMQFIQNIEETFKYLSQSLNKNGLLCFAVFNPLWVMECKKTSDKFRMSLGKNNEEQMIMNFGNEKFVDVYIRNATIYDKIIEKFGFKKVVEEYPPFTDDYITKYKPTFPTNVSEYMILGYKRE